VGCGVVEQFRAKLIDTGIHRGIIVSSNGFTKSALEKASAHNIECYTLKEAQNIDWCLCKDIMVCNQQPTYLYLAVKIAEDHCDQFTLFEKAGVSNIEISGETLRKFIISIFQQASHKFPVVPDGKEQQALIEIENYDKFFIVTDSGLQLDIVKLTLIVKYKTNKHLIPLSYHNYENVIGNKEICSFATAPINLGKDTFTYVIKKDTKNIEIKLIPTKHLT
jgi:hypothetical protein